MALDQCVKSILCGLGDAALRSIQALINSQVALIQAQILIYQTQLLQFDILALPVEAAQAAVQSIVDEAREAAAIIPLNQISECVDLGEFNVNLNDALNLVLAGFDDITAEAISLLSYRDELNAIVEELNATITQFTDISGVIDECFAGT